MLLELRVENLGIIEEILLPFGPGMTVITGETGAGKTLLVDALELLCGGRADPGAVRDGAAEARVEGRFAPTGEGEDEVVLARVVPAVGRSRGYADGRLATAGELAGWGRRLVDLHGQHTHQSLLVSVEQRALLDRACGDAATRAIAQLRDARQTVRRVDEQLVALGGDERVRAREADLLRYQLAEIEGGAIADADEDDRLAAEEDLLADAEAHRDALATAYETLEGAGEDALGRAAGALAGRAAFANLAARVHALQAETAEVARDVRLTLESVAMDPERLVIVQARRARLHELMRKYGRDLAAVLAYGDEVRCRLEELETHDARAAALDAERTEAETEARRAAAELSRIRAKAATPLAAAVTEQLRALAMPKASFTVELAQTGMSDDGSDDVSFLLAPNPGEPHRPLARAASGGELARAMLALRVVLSEAPPTLVFDEVDAGIGGEAGSAVGRALAGLGGHHQVLCVTHLPQVAAFADAHVVVTKSERKARTVASASLLLDDARIAELARMLAGDLDSQHAREHARELMSRAAAARTKARTKARAG
jgi:DNA repair protein RecN (Recombination protein N)